MIRPLSAFRLVKYRLTIRLEIMVKETLNERKIRERIEMLKMPPEEAVKYTLRREHFPNGLKMLPQPKMKPRKAFGS